MSASGRLRVAVVGGSLGGLLTSLILSEDGVDVHVFERSPEPLEGRGAGIVLHPLTVRQLQAARALDLARVSSSSRVLRYLTRPGDVLLEEPIHYLFTSYASLYEALLGQVAATRYHLGTAVTGFEEHDDRVLVRFADRGDDSFDLVVGADGIHSTVRATLFPDVVPEYAGYVGWRGTLPDSELSSTMRHATAGALTYFVGVRTHMLSYPIPDPTLGRLTNWVWYRNLDAGRALDAVMTDRRGVRHDLSLPPGAARTDHVRSLRAAAREELPPAFAELVWSSPNPFVQVIVDIGVPRMATRRVCLVGDAAFSLRPHIAAGTAKAAADAHALADALRVCRRDVPNALRMWEPRQRSIGRAALERAREIGTAVQVAGTYSPGDPAVAFGLFVPGDNGFPGIEEAVDASK